MLGMNYHRLEGTTTKGLPVTGVLGVGGPDNRTREVPPGGKTGVVDRGCGPLPTMTKRGAAFDGVVAVPSCAGRRGAGDLMPGVRLPDV